jgi:hypothetical protein
MKHVCILFLFIALICTHPIASAQKKKLIDINVTLTDSSQVKGILGSITDSTVQIFGRKKEFKPFSGIKICPDSTIQNRWLRFHEIRSISYRKTSAIKTGALIGLGVGAAAGLIVGSNKTECETSTISGAACDLDNGLDNLLTQSLITVAGMGLGALMGSTYKSVEISGTKSKFILFRQKVALK